MTDALLSFIVHQSPLQCIFLFKPQHRFPLWTQKTVRTEFLHATPAEFLLLYLIIAPSSQEISKATICVVKRIYLF